MPRKPGPRITCQCNYCGQSFERTPGEIRQAEKDGATRCFCSRACWQQGTKGANNHGWKGGEKTTICAWCHQTFSRPLTWPKGQRFCSLACSTADKLSRARYTTCEVCRRRFYDPKGQRFCSEQCFTDWHAGPNNEQWKGGVSTENEKARRIPRYKNWRDAVFQRDDYTCQKCSKRGVYVQAHHLYAFARFPDLRYVAENGHTLCLDCHRGFNGHEDDYLIELGFDPGAPPW